jgi:hypothetical protein
MAVSQLMELFSLHMGLELDVLVLSSHSAYEPPTGMNAMPINLNTAASEFEWNELAKRSGVELWCIRVPSTVGITACSRTIYSG